MVRHVDNVRAVVDGIGNAVVRYAITLLAQLLDALHHGGYDFLFRLLLPAHRAAEVAHLFARPLVADIASVGDVRIHSLRLRARCALRGRDNHLVDAERIAHLGKHTFGRRADAVNARCYLDFHNLYPLLTAADDGAGSPATGNP